MRRAAILLVLCGCIPAQPALMRTLQNEREEVRSAESSELAYRAHTPDLKPLVGAERKDLEGDLGPGQCLPQGAGERCTWRFFVDGPNQRGGPVLSVDFDADKKVAAAHWEQLE